MLKRIFNSIKNFVVEEYKFLICTLIFYIICTWPVNYYIIIGGGIDDVSDRIEVEDAYDSKGSFNISYVSELKGTVLTYGLSYVIPSWDRESMSDYKYSEDEDYKDIDFRGELDLKTANGSAIKNAYQLADEEYSEVSSKIYVIANFNEYKTELDVGDELLSVEGKSFDTPQEYSKFIQGYNVGDKLVVKVKRAKKEVELECKVHELDGTKLFGVALQLVKEYETDPDVEIKFKKEESGLSGGLITTLEIYNQLTKNDITNSLKIAGTGTVSDDGTVGSIGGVRYKLIGAEAGGADVFLVPAGKNYKECLKVKKEKKLDIEIISVSNVSEAIEKLAELEL